MVREEAKAQVVIMDAKKFHVNLGGGMHIMPVYNENKETLLKQIGW
jgi:hypothetical protein